MTVALVTGASRGLGAVMARKLAADGFAVAVNYGSDDFGAAATVAAITAVGGKAQAFKFDVTDSEQVKSGVAAIVAGLGPIDVIVNNAIAGHAPRPVEEQGWDYHLRQLEFCVKAPLELLQAVLADWKARGTGVVINIGSEVVGIGNPEMSHYVGAKAAMIGLTRSWARELGVFGIRVNLVEPGYILVERHKDDSAEGIESYRKDVPLGHMGEPGDIAEMVAFLASPRAKFVTGQTLAVNGGRTLG
jgi:3-oxoacyl-[acyl-carrier protein] reductase